MAPIMIVGVPREVAPGERRVALAPDVIPAFIRMGMKVLCEAGAGVAAGFVDAMYVERGATIAPSRGDLFRASGVIVQIQAPSMAGAPAAEDLRLLTRDHVVIAQCDPLGSPDAVRRLAETGATVFALELIPRITRAQAMDVLSSQASLAGYKAALLAATRATRQIPLMMTAAGTIRAARALVIGAGVAGLQAIATLRRLGAVIEAYDVRPAVREQVESLGAKFLAIGLTAKDAEDRSGYARAMDDSFYQAQRDLMSGAVAGADIVITTAAVPGGRAPVLVTESMVRAMRAGSVIVDLAAARGGNCECTRADEDVDVGGVLVLGPTNLPATIPADASTLYARNVAAFLAPLLREGRVTIDRSDEVVAQSLLCQDGRVVHHRVCELLGLPCGPDATGDGAAPSTSGSRAAETSE